MPLTDSWGSQIDQIFRRLPQLNYLPALAYSFFMILVGTAYPNAFGFAKHILIAFSPEVKDPYDLNPHAVKGIAVAVVAVVTLVLYQDKLLAIRMNKPFALYKVGLLLVLSIIGFTYRREGIKWARPANGGKFVSAFFVALFSYQGWETPFYVCPHPKSERGVHYLIPHRSSPI
jgi:amino acid permease